MPLQPLVYWLAIEHDVEDIRRYMTGGFHPIIFGDVMNCRLFFLCCLYWVAWLVLRACLRDSIVRHRLHLTVWHVSGRDGGALCWSAVVLEELLGVQRELSHYAYVLWKLSFWTYLHWPGISHVAADSAWQFKLDHLTNCKLTNAPTKVDVSEFIALIGSMLKMNPGSRPSADEVLQHPWFACGKLITGKVPSDIVNIILS